MIYIALNLDELLFDCYHCISMKVTSSIGSLKPQHTIVWKSKKTNIQKPQFKTLIRISFKLFEHLLLFRTWCLRSSFFYHVLGRTSLLHFTRQNCLLNVWNHSTLHHYHPHEYSLVNRTDFTDLHRQRLAFPSLSLRKPSLQSLISLLNGSNHLHKLFVFSRRNWNLYHLWCFNFSD